ncbi:MAG TPA: hypothetical protein VF846_19910 [Thermoanaerobaculia bacterium]|jgi:protocatechuate 3,4-dioxygenase beta subunit
MIDSAPLRGIAASLLALLVALPAAAQDREWIRMWETAQRQRPRTVASIARIAPDKERGTPLIVHGRVYENDGKTPRAGVIVFAYQTDAAGVYHRRGERGWRLRGWARSDANGRFEFRTIRPAPYPNATEPAHIHFTIEAPKLQRRWTPDLQFAGDRLLTARDKRASSAAGPFGSIRAVTTRAGVQHVDFNIRVADEGRF